MSDDVVSEMRAAWGRAVFDGFLVDDLQQIARRALARDGYVDADVTATVDPASGPADKTITVKIAPGIDYADRRLAFSGNRAVSTDDLEDAIASAGLGTQVWLNPDALEQTLDAYYQARGYLDVKVTPGAPEFSGTTATRPVRVDEGPAFQVGAIEIRGNDAFSTEEVVASFGLTAGNPYQPGDVEPARRRVEDLYLRNGYNDVRVSVSVEPHRAPARVTVTVTIDEGPKQVVSGVEVRGAKSIDRGVIDRAVDLTPGQPASLAKVYRAQKRLYDTGIFQNAEVTLEPVEHPSVPPPAGIQPVQAVVTLKEVPRYRLRYGFRLNDEVAPAQPTRVVRPAFVADLLRRRLFGRALTVGVAGEAESNLNLARGYLSVPTLFGRGIVTNLFATTSRQVFPPASQYRPHDRRARHGVHVRAAVSSGTRDERDVRL